MKIDRVCYLQCIVSVFFAISIISGCSDSSNYSPPPSSSTSSSTSSQSTSSASSSSSNAPPTITIGPSITVTEEQQIKLTALVNDPESSEATVTWAQTSGPAASWEVVNPTEILLTLPTTAQYKITMQATATDDGGLESTASKDIGKYASGVRVLAAVGSEAPGLRDRNIQQLHQPAVGANGHIAFLGAYNNQSGGELTSALWTGSPDDLEMVLQTGDSIEDAPAGARFDLSADDIPVVNRLGHVLFTAYLQNADGKALLVYKDGQTQHLLSEGDHAPGLAANVIVSELIYFAFSESGAAIQGLTSSGVQVLWYWDFNQLEVIVAASDQRSQYENIPQARATHYTGNCYFRTLNYADSVPLQMNDAGEILFWTIYSGSGSSSCPYDDYEYVKWRAGNFTKVLTFADPVPNMTNFEFALNQDTDQAVLQPDGAVTISTRVSDDLSSSFEEDFFPSQWLINKEGDVLLLALAGEEFSDNNGFIGDPLFSYHLAAYPSSSGNVFVVVPEEVTGYDTLLRGAPRQNPYRNTANLGENPLQVILRERDESRGGPEGSRLGEAGYLSTSKVGTVTVVGSRIGDSLDEDNPAVFWHGVDQDDIREVFASGDTIDFSGDQRPVLNVAVYEGPWGSGAPTSSSENGIVAFTGLWGVAPAILTYIP